MAAKALRTSCNFTTLIPKGRRSPPGTKGAFKQYMVVSVLTARHVLRARRRFEVNDIKFRTIPGGDQKLVRSWAGEFLSSWERGENPQESFGANLAVRVCPVLHERTKKWWVGY